MTLAFDIKTPRAVDRLSDRFAMLATNIVYADPVAALNARRQALLDRQEEGVANGVAPLVIFTVLIAFLALLAAAMSVAVLIFCSQKGMNFEWYVKTSWFEVKVACRA